MNKPTAKNQPVPAPEPTPAAKRVHRNVMEALMLAYDEGTKAYAAGYSDQRIAEETTASPDYVRKTREDYFGPLAEPSALAAIREEARVLTEQVARLRSDTAAAVKVAESKISKLNQELDRVARSNGWA